MKYGKVILYYALANIIYLFVSMIFICRQDGFLLSTYSFVYQFMLPYTIGCIFLNQFFSSIAVSRFDSRRKVLQVHIILDFTLAFLMASLLFFMLLIFRLVLHLPSDLLAIMCQYIRFLLAAIQFSLLSKIFCYSNVRFINHSGYILTFMLCTFEILGIVRFSRYFFSLSISIFFSWAICEDTVYGYIIPMLLSVLLFIILNYQISKRDFV